MFTAGTTRTAPRRTSAPGTEPQLSLDFFEYSLVPSFFDASKSVRELGATYRPIDRTIADAIAWFEKHGKL